MTILQYKVILAAILNINQFLLVQQKSSARISGARAISFVEYPYVVQISLLQGDQRILICTGSLIASTWTITAGHCVVGMKLRKMKHIVVYTEPNRAQIAHRFVDYIVSYPSFNSRGREDNDIGLVKHERIPIKEFGKISSIDYNSLYGESCLVAGYGSVDEAGTTYADVLQALDGVVILCQTMHMANRINILKTQLVYPSFCVARKCNTKLGILCGGDSGGPLIHKSGIIGISSRSYDCSDNATKEVGIFMPISIYVSWIKKTIDMTNTSRANMHKKSRRLYDRAALTNKRQVLSDYSMKVFANTTTPKIITISSDSKKVHKFEGKRRLLKYFSRKNKL